jgi:hypothetical protein
MNSRIVAFVLLFVAGIPGALADTVSCPGLSAAVQVAACPSEDDLKFTFNGFCSDNSRMYAKDTDVCTDYQRYRQLKNVALWESGDGAFQAYVSCDLPAAAVRSMKAVQIAASRKGSITRLVCDYPDGVTFTSRTKAECRVDEKTSCSSDPSACRAVCD